MPIQTAETNLRSLQYSVETNWAETPSTPAMTIARSTGDTLSYNKSQVTSKEIRADRQVPSVIETGDTMDGSLNVELSLGGTYDEFIAAVLGNPWTDVSITALTLTFAVAISGVASVVRSVGNWVTDGFIIETWVKFGGTGIHVNNAGPYKIKSFSTTSTTNDTMNLYDPDGLVDASGATAGTAKASWVRNGVLRKSFLFEKNFSDIASGNAFIQYLGMRAVDMTLNFKSQSILDGSFMFWGRLATVSSATVAGSQVQPTSTPSVSASANIGEIYQNDAKLAEALKDLTLTLSNTPRHRPIIGSKYDADIGYGLFDVKVTGTALVPDLTMFAEVVNHSTVSFDLPVFDSLGNYLYITIPAIKISGNPDTPAANQDVDMKINGMGFIDPLSGHMIQFDRIVAPS